MRYVNLLKHKITLLEEGSNVKLAEILPVGVVARMVPVRKRIRTVNGVQIVMMENTVEGLPKPEKGLFYITSNVVAQHVRRPDVIAPATGPKDCLRDENNQLLGVYRFQYWENS